jgi:predicted metal-dependent hydrolase
MEDPHLPLKKKHITVDGTLIEVERKRVKNVNFTIYPPDGRVRVSAPARLSEKALYEAIEAKLPWIRRHKHRLIRKNGRPALKYVTGEYVEYQGERYRLLFFETTGRPQVVFGSDHTLEVTVRHRSSRAKREKLLVEWYRAQLKVLIPPLIQIWEPVLGVKVADWGVKRMKTRWGSCNIQARRIWLNLALIRYPPNYLEYVVVHEMTHLLERGHNARFYAYLDQFLPGWQEIRAALKEASTRIPM